MSGFYSGSFGKDNYTGSQVCLKMLMDQGNKSEECDNSDHIWLSRVHPSSVIAYPIQGHGKSRAYPEGYR